MHKNECAGYARNSNTKRETNQLRACIVGIFINETGYIVQRTAQGGSR